MDFYLNKTDDLVMRGNIQGGDFKKFLNIYSNLKSPPKAFYVHSEGGNLEEAMLIGEVIRQSYIPLVAPVKCSSACFFLYASAVQRKANGNLGLHRPYFDPVYFSNLSPSNAEQEYNRLISLSRAYLRRMGISEEYIEKMFSVDSQDIWQISSDESDEMFGFRIPAFDEWLIAKCGKTSTGDDKVLRSYSVLQAIRLVDGDFSKLKLSQTELLEKASLALELEKAGLIEEYVQRFYSRLDCENAATDSHIRQVFSSYKKSSD
tara:strand:- start:269 stop:1054 length:786 start_codon:yes stop_codon:yes gene_type:complete